jgi:hypothetical protein
MVLALASSLLLNEASDATQKRRQAVIRKLTSAHYRLYSRKKDAKTGRRRNLGTFTSLEAAKRHERAVQYFKRAS